MTTHKPKPPEGVLEEAVARYQSGNYTADDLRVIESAYRKAKSENIRELKRQTSGRTQWLR